MVKWVRLRDPAPWHRRASPVGFRLGDFAAAVFPVVLSDDSAALARSAVAVPPFQIFPSSDGGSPAGIAEYTVHRRMLVGAR